MLLFRVQNVLAILSKNGRAKCQSDVNVFIIVLRQATLIQVNISLIANEARHHSCLHDHVKLYSRL